VIILFATDPRYRKIMSGAIAAGNVDGAWLAQEKTLAHWLGQGPSAGMMRGSAGGGAGGHTTPPGANPTPRRTPRFPPPRWGTRPRPS
jgi:hypothetical protein